VRLVLKKCRLRHGNLQPDPAALANLVLTHRRRAPLFWYNRPFTPGILFQKRWR